MTDREKMIEVMRGADNKSFVSLMEIEIYADRLIAAGFVCFKGEKLTIRQAVECDNGNLWVRWPE